jgi:hypothetical protein
MTPAQLAEVLEEIAAWDLDARRAYIANLAILSKEDAEQVKAGLKRIWDQRNK